MIMRPASDDPSRFPREDPLPRWDAPLLGHPNRSRYALGGLAVAVGIRVEDAAALAGLLAVSFADAAAWIEEAADATQARYALRVMHAAIERHRTDCETAGQRIILARNDSAEPPLGRSTEDVARFVLGSQFYQFGLRYTHAHALAGLFALGAPAMLKRLANVPGRRRTLGGRLLPALREGFAHLDRLGRTSSFNRGAAAYRDRCRRFAEREAASDDRSWRDAPPTRRQRWTILDTAIALGLQPPAPTTCGEAADWLEAHGAILKYRKDER